MSALKRFLKCWRSEFEFPEEIYVGYVKEPVALQHEVLRLMEVLEKGLEGHERELHRMANLVSRYTLFYDSKESIVRSLPTVHPTREDEFLFEVVMRLSVLIESVENISNARKNLRYLCCCLCGWMEVLRWRFMLKYWMHNFEKRREYILKGLRHVAARRYPQCVEQGPTGDPLSEPPTSSGILSFKWTMNCLLEKFMASHRRPLTSGIKQLESWDKVIVLLANSLRILWPSDAVGEYLVDMTWKDAAEGISNRIFSGCRFLNLLISPDFALKIIRNGILFELFDKKPPCTSTVWEGAFLHILAKATKYAWAIGEPIHHDIYFHITNRKRTEYIAQYTDPTVCTSKTMSLEGGSPTSYPGACLEGDARYWNPPSESGWHKYVYDYDDFRPTPESCIVRILQYLSRFGIYVPVVPPKSGLPSVLDDRVPGDFAHLISKKVSSKKSIAQILVYLMRPKVVDDLYRHDVTSLCEKAKGEASSPEIGLTASDAVDELGPSIREIILEICNIVAPYTQPQSAVGKGDKPLSSFLAELSDAYLKRVGRERSPIARPELGRDIHFQIFRMHQALSCASIANDGKSRVIPFHPADMVEEYKARAKVLDCDIARKIKLNEFPPETVRDLQRGYRLSKSSMVLKSMSNLTFLEKPVRCSSEELLRQQCGDLRLGRNEDLELITRLLPLSFNGALKKDEQVMSNYETIILNLVSLFPFYGVYLFNKNFIQNYLTNPENNEPFTVIVTLKLIARLSRYIVIYEPTILNILFEMVSSGAIDVSEPMKTFQLCTAILSICNFLPMHEANFTPKFVHDDETAKKEEDEGPEEPMPCGRMTDTEMGDGQERRTSDDEDSDSEEEVVEFDLISIKKFLTPLFGFKVKENEKLFDEFFDTFPLCSLQNYPSIRLDDPISIPRIGAPFEQDNPNFYIPSCMDSDLVLQVIHDGTATSPKSPPADVPVSYEEDWLEKVGAGYQTIDTIREIIKIRILLLSNVSDWVLLLLEKILTALEKLGDENNSKTTVKEEEIIDNTFVDTIQSLVICLINEFKNKKKIKKIILFFIKWTLKNKSFKKLTNSIALALGGNRNVDALELALQLIAPKLVTHQPPASNGPPPSNDQPNQKPQPSYQYEVNTNTSTEQLEWLVGILCNISRLADRKYLKKHCLDIQNISWAMLHHSDPKVFKSGLRLLADTAASIVDIYPISSRVDEFYPLKDTQILSWALPRWIKFRHYTRKGERRLKHMLEYQEIQWSCATEEDIDIAIGMVANVGLTFLAELESRRQKLSGTGPLEGYDVENWADSLRQCIRNEDYSNLQLIESPFDASGSAEKGKDCTELADVVYRSVKCLRFLNGALAGAFPDERKRILPTLPTMPKSDRPVTELFLSFGQKMITAYAKHFFGLALQPQEFTYQIVPPKDQSGEMDLVKLGQKLIKLTMKLCVREGLMNENTNHVKNLEMWNSFSVWSNPAAKIHPCGILDYMSMSSYSERVQHLWCMRYEARQNDFCWEGSIRRDLALYLFAHSTYLYADLRRAAQESLAFVTKIFEVSKYELAAAAVKMFRNVAQAALAHDRQNKILDAPAKPQLLAPTPIMDANTPQPATPNATADVHDAPAEVIGTPISAQKVSELDESLRAVSDAVKTDSAKHEAPHIPGRSASRSSAMAAVEAESLAVDSITVHSSGGPSAAGDESLGSVEKETREENPPDRRSIVADSMDKAHVLQHVQQTGLVYIMGAESIMWTIMTSPSLSIGLNEAIIDRLSIALESPSLKGRILTLTRHMLEYRVRGTVYASLTALHRLLQILETPQQRHWRSQLVALALMICLCDEMTLDPNAVWPDPAQPDPTSGIDVVAGDRPDAATANLMNEQSQAADSTASGARSNFPHRVLAVLTEYADCRKHTSLLATLAACGLTVVMKIFLTRKRIYGRSKPLPGPSSDKRDYLAARSNSPWFSTFASPTTENSGAEGKYENAATAWKAERITELQPPALLLLDEVAWRLLADPLFVKSILASLPEIHLQLTKGNNEADMQYLTVIDVVRLERSWPATRVLKAWKHMSLHCFLLTQTLFQFIHRYSQSSLEPILKEIVIPQLMAWNAEAMAEEDAHAAFATTIGGLWRAMRLWQPEEIEGILGLIHPVLSSEIEKSNAEEHVWWDTIRYALIGMLSPNKLRVNEAASYEVNWKCFPSAEEFVRGIFNSVICGQVSIREFLRPPAIDPTKPGTQQADRRRLRLMRVFLNECGYAFPEVADILQQIVTTKEAMNHPYLKSREDVARSLTHLVNWAARTRDLWHRQPNSQQVHTAHKIAQRLGTILKGRLHTLLVALVLDRTRYTDRQHNLATAPVSGAETANSAMSEVGAVSETVISPSGMAEVARNEESSFESVEEVLKAGEMASKAEWERRMIPTRNEIKTWMTFTWAGNSNVGNSSVTPFDLLIFELALQARTHPDPDLSRIGTNTSTAFLANPKILSADWALALEAGIAIRRACPKIVGYAPRGVAVNGSDEAGEALLQEYLRFLDGLSERLTVCRSLNKACFLETIKMYWVGSQWMMKNTIIKLLEAFVLRQRLALLAANDGLTIGLVPFMEDGLMEEQVTESSTKALMTVYSTLSQDFRAHQARHYSVIASGAAGGLGRGSRRVGGIYGMSVLISLCAYTVPVWLPRVLEEFAKNGGRNSPDYLKNFIQKILQEFFKNHKKKWNFQTKFYFTEEQLDTLNQYKGMPIYFS